MEERTKQNLLVTVCGILLFAALMNLSAVIGFAKNVLNLILPVLAGGILALFISVPMNGIQKRIEKYFGKKEKTETVSFLLTLLCVAIVLLFVLKLLIPELIKSSQSLYIQIEENIARWIFYLDNNQLNDEWLKDLISHINIEELMKNATNWLHTLVPNVVSALSSTVNIVITVAFALIISIYMVLEKRTVFRHTKKLLSAYLKLEWAENILRFCRMFYKSFSQFLSGQCTEAVILGILIFGSFTIFHLPYAILVGVLTAVCSIIPYIGAFISCIISIFLTVIYDPTLVIKCTVVYLSIQFIENQFIYPRVVGKSVGLPPFYTLIAALFGGKLFGILGIIFFIPLTAVLIDLMKEDANRRLKEKKRKR